MCMEKQTGWQRCVCLYLHNEYAVEIQGACLVFLIGIWLFFNDTFQVSPVYTIMSSIASEKIWSLLFIGIGLIQVLAVFFDTRSYECALFTVDCRWVRRHILLVKGAIWFTLFFGVIFGDARALSAPFYLVFSFNAFRAFFCIKA